MLRRFLLSPRQKITLALLAAVFVLSSATFARAVYLENTILLPAAGGVYREAQVGTVKRVNPLFCEANDPDRDLCRLVFTGLVKRDPATNAVKPDLAEKIIVSEDRTNFTFFLRADAKFHDGESVTADDVIFTLKILNDPDYDGPLRGEFAGILAKKIDDRTVSVTAPEPDAFFLEKFTVGILPRHLLAEIPVLALQNDVFNQKPVGTGPYRLVSVSLDEARLERFDDFYGPEPFLDGVVIDYFPEFADLAADRSRAENIKFIPGDQLADFRAEGDWTLTPLEFPQFVGLFFNTQSANLKHREIRRALGLALDRSEISALVPAARPIGDPVTREAPPAVGSGADTAAGIFKKLGFNKNSDGKLVASQSYQSTTRAFIETKTPLLSVRIVAPDRPEFARIAAWAADSWEKLGVTVETDLRPSKEFGDAVKTRDYDVLISGQTLADPLDFWPILHSSQGHFPGLNFAQFSDPQTDEILEKIRQTFTGEGQTELLAGLADRIREDVPFVALYAPQYFFATDPDLRGVSLAGQIRDFSDRFLELPNWWLRETREWK